MIKTTNNNKDNKMIFSKAKTRYQAQKENPDCFSFYKVEGGYACFYCWQRLRTWRNQK